MQSYSAKITPMRQSNFRSTVSPKEMTRVFEIFKCLSNICYVDDQWECAMWRLLTNQICFNKLISCVKKRHMVYPQQFPSLYPNLMALVF